MASDVRSNGIQAAIGAALMLYFGWMAPLESGTDIRLHIIAVDVFFWTLKIGGIGLALVAAISFAGLRVGLILDAIVSGLCGFLMIASAGCMLISAGDTFGVLYAIFGAMFLHAAAGSWSSFREQPGTPTSSRSKRWYGGEKLPTVAVVDPAPPHPASIRPASLPGEHEPPPPEGYLAALSKEKGEPPTASYE